MKKCPVCGNLFECTADEKCWCMSIKIPDAVKVYISSCYNECLCRKCIDNLIGRYNNSVLNKINRS